MTGPEVKEWDAGHVARARYLHRVGTPMERISEEGGVPVLVARARIEAACRKGPVVPLGMPEAMDAYMAFLGIA